MDYEEAYKKALERAKKLKETCDSTAVIGWCEYIFPELAESEGERIRGAIIDHLKDHNLIEWAAWLEKQGEQDPKQEDNTPKCEPFRIKKGEWYVCVHDFCNKAIRIGEIIQAEHDDTIRGIGFLYMENKYFRPAFENEKPQVDGFDAELNTLLKKYEHLPKEEVAECLSFYLGVVQGEQKPEERYEIKVDNSNSVNGNPFDYENATIVQKDFTSKEVICTHEVEVGNGNIKALVTEKIPIDKVEPKFKVGDWCIDNEDGTIFQIVKVLGNTYTYKTNEGKEYSCTHYSLENDAKLWTIQDAKDGDVLAWDDSKCIALFKNIYDEDSFNSHGFVGHCTGVFESRLSYHDIEGAHPATKEQRDLLFQKMHEAGYEWDTEKKELEKIVNEEQIKKNLQDNSFRRMFEQKPVWSEEDSIRLQRIIDFLWKNRKGDTDTIYQQEQDVDWLKSLKQRYTWKPSEEQLRALHDINLTGNISYAGQGHTLIELYNDLKKLTE